MMDRRITKWYSQNQPYHWSSVEEPGQHLKLSTCQDKKRYFKEPPVTRSKGQRSRGSSNKQMGNSLELAWKSHWLRFHHFHARYSWVWSSQQLWTLGNLNEQGFISQRWAASTATLWFIHDKSRKSLCFQLPAGNHLVSTKWCCGVGYLLYWY